MNDTRQTLLALGRDIALAYAGGLVLGAPVALLAVRITGIERLATVALLTAMAALFFLLRRDPRHSADGDVADAHSAPGASSAARHVA